MVDNGIRAELIGRQIAEAEIAPRRPAGPPRALRRHRRWYRRQTPRARRRSCSTMAWSISGAGLARAGAERVAADDRGEAGWSRPEFAEQAAERGPRACWSRPRGVRRAPRGHPAWPRRRGTARVWRAMFVGIEVDQHILQRGHVESPGPPLSASAARSICPVPPPMKRRAVRATGTAGRPIWTSAWLSAWPRSSRGIEQRAVKVETDNIEGKVRVQVRHGPVRDGPFWKLQGNAGKNVCMTESSCSARS